MKTSQDFLGQQNRATRLRKIYVGMVGRGATARGRGGTLARVRGGSEFGARRGKSAGEGGVGIVSLGVLPLKMGAESGVDADSHCSRRIVSYIYDYIRLAT